MNKVHERQDSIEYSVMDRGKFTSSELKVLSRRLENVWSQILDTIKDKISSEKFVQLYTCLSSTLIEKIVNNMKQGALSAEKWVSEIGISTELYSVYGDLLISEIQQFTKIREMLLKMRTTSKNTSPNLSPPLSITENELNDVLEGLSQMSSKPPSPKEKPKFVDITNKFINKREKAKFEEEKSEVSRKSTPNFKSFDYIQQDNERSLAEMGQFGGVQLTKAMSSRFCPPFKKRNPKKNK